jgi:hypothetical protein
VKVSALLKFEEIVDMKHLLYCYNNLLSALVFFFGHAPILTIGEKQRQRFLSPAAVWIQNFFFS